MNYYNTPNYYPTYPYNNTNPYMNQYNAAPQPQMLNGKMVDSIDVVRATEVPIGGYGVFPKADLTELYIKSWNNNGTTSITTFKPIMAVENSEKANNEILEKINILSEKIDAVLSKQIPQTEPTASKKGKTANDY